MTVKIYSYILLLILISSNLSFAQDVEGSKDHPLITRYPEAVIKAYEENNFREYGIAVGPQTGYRNIDEWVETSGKLTRIYYELEGTVTLSEIYGNYLSAMEKEGFEILAKGNHPARNVSKEVGGGAWLSTFYTKNRFENKDILLGTGSATTGGTCYIAGKLTKGAGSVYVTLAGKEYSTEKKIFMVDILEETAMEDDLVSVNADAMLKGLQAEGKIALYGIFFDTDKADVKSESNPVINEIANLLNNNPSLNIYIVGHTDMQGGLEHNMELSERRAGAVVSELTSKHNIGSSRLTPKGVGPLAPVATNETDAGREKNRRVELVLK